MPGSWNCAVVRPVAVALVALALEPMAWDWPVVVVSQNDDVSVPLEKKPTSPPNWGGAPLMAVVA